MDAHWVHFSMYNGHIRHNEPKSHNGPNGPDGPDGHIENLTDTGQKYQIYDECPLDMKWLSIGHQ